MRWLVFVCLCRTAEAIFWSSPEGRITLDIPSDGPIALCSNMTWQVTGAFPLHMVALSPGLVPPPMQQNPHWSFISNIRPRLKYAGAIGDPSWETEMNFRNLVNGQADIYLFDVSLYGHLMGTVNVAGGDQSCIRDRADTLALLQPQLAAASWSSSLAALSASAAPVTLSTTAPTPPALAWDTASSSFEPAVIAPSSSSPVASSSASSSAIRSAAEASASAASDTTKDPPTLRTAVLVVSIVAGVLLIVLGGIVYRYVRRRRRKTRELSVLNRIRRPPSAGGLSLADLDGGGVTAAHEKDAISLAGSEKDDAWERAEQEKADRRPTRLVRFRSPLPLPPPPSATSLPSIAYSPHRQPISPIFLLKGDEAERLSTSAVLEAPAGPLQSFFSASTSSITNRSTQASSYRSSDASSFWGGGRASQALSGAPTGDGSEGPSAAGTFGQLAKGTVARAAIDSSHGRTASSGSTFFCAGQPSMTSRATTTSSHSIGRAL